MKFPIGFRAESQHDSPTTTANTNTNHESLPVRSLVDVHFPTRNMTLSYYKRVIAKVDTTEMHHHAAENVRSFLTEIFGEEMNPWAENERRMQNSFVADLTDAGKGESS